MMIYVVKRTFQGYFFWTLNFDGSPFSGQLRQERVIYLKRKPYNVPFESNTETGRISVMRGSRPVLVKVVPFQLRGPGHPQDDTTPNFFLILKALCKGFQMRYHLFLNSIRKIVKTPKVSSRRLALKFQSITTVSSQEQSSPCVMLAQINTYFTSYIAK